MPPLTFEVEEGRNGNDNAAAGDTPAEPALMAFLSSLRFSSLKSIAVSKGLSAGAMEAALNSENPTAALVECLLDFLDPALDPALLVAPVLLSEDEEARKKTFTEKCIPLLTNISLYAFNGIAFVVSSSMVLGQMVAFQQFDVESAELVLLGFSIAALAALSGLGLYGTYKNHQAALRMYAFMLMVMILQQISIVWVLYSNTDSSFTDQLLKLMGTLCDVNEVDLASALSFATNTSAQGTGLDSSWDGAVNWTSNATNSSRNLAMVRPCSVRTACVGCRSYRGW